VKNQRLVMGRIKEQKSFNLKDRICQMSGIKLFLCDEEFDE
jgi:hypothetical protein